MKNVTVFNTQLGRWIDYEVSATENTPKRISFYKQDYDGYYVPEDRPTRLFVTGFSSVEKYNYAFTEKEVKTTTTTKDIYLNERNNKYIAKCRRNTNTRLSYSW